MPSLYGTVTRTLALECVPMFFQPSDRLLEDLACLSPGTIVGVQALNAEDSAALGMVPFIDKIDTPDFMTMPYWETIAKQNPHLLFASLEDGLYWREFLQGASQYVALFNELKQGGGDLETYLRLERKLQFQGTIERNALVESMIAMTNPAVVIGHSGFTDYLFDTNPGKFSSYDRELPPAVDARIAEVVEMNKRNPLDWGGVFTFLNRDMPSNTLVRQATADTQTLAYFAEKGSYGASLDVN